MFNDIRTASVCGDKVYLKGNKCYSDNYRVWFLYNRKIFSLIGYILL